MTLNRLLLFTLCALVAPSVKAVGISWYSNVPSTFYSSDGSSLDDSYFFEIGTFNAGFTPDLNNIASWQANWNVFDRTYAPYPNNAPPENQTSDNNGIWDPNGGFFGGFSSLQSNNTSDSTDADPAHIFTTGSQFYLWVYNGKDIVPGNEWALVTRTTQKGDVNDWIMPDPSTVADTQLYLQDSDTALFGGVNGVQGAGDYDTVTAPAAFNLQTHAVPEPSSLLLTAIAAIGLQRRRRPIAA